MSPDALPEMSTSLSSSRVSSVVICVSTYALMLCWVASAVSLSCESVSLSWIAFTDDPLARARSPERVALASVESPVAVRVPADFTPTEEICKADT